MRYQHAREGFFPRLVIGKHENPNSHDTFHWLEWAAAGGYTHNFLSVSWCLHDPFLLNPVLPMQNGASQGCRYQRTGCSLPEVNQTGVPYHLFHFFPFLLSSLWKQKLLKGMPLQADEKAVFLPQWMFTQERQLEGKRLSGRAGDAW